MRVIYIAGPFTGPTPWDVEQNVRRAEAVALEVAKLGAAPLCPHANSRFFHGQCTPEFWYAATMALLKRCDAILMIPGWENSKGSREEKQWAVDNGVPVFHWSDGCANLTLIDWINSSCT